MSITAEIREWVVQRFVDGLQEEHELLVMCDRIDAQADECDGFCKRLEEAAKGRADVTILGVDYIALPVDADGVPIHIGDVMDGTCPSGKHVNGTVSAIGDGVFWLSNVQFALKPDYMHHYHAPTVEGVLRDFGVDIAHALDADPDATVPEAIIAEYAAKLRELVLDLFKGFECGWLSDVCGDCERDGEGMPIHGCQLLNRASELGIEVPC